MVPYATPASLGRPFWTLLAGGGVVILAAVVLSLGIITAFDYRSISTPQLALTAMILAGIFSFTCLAADIMLLFRATTK